MRSAIFTSSQNKNFRIESFNLCIYKAVVGKKKVTVRESADCTSSENAWLIALFIILAYLGLGQHLSCLEWSINGNMVLLEATETPKVYVGFK